MNYLNYKRFPQVFIGLVLATFLISCESNPTDSPTTSAEIESEAPQADWQLIQGNGISLYLPPSYIGGNPETDLDEIREGLIAINPEYEQRVEQIEQNAGDIALMAFESEQPQQGFLTNVNITSTEAEEATLEEYIEAITTQLSQIYTIEDSNSAITVGEYPAGKITASIEAPDATVKQLFYIIQDESTFWIVTYATTSDAFDERLSEFEQSVQSITLSQPVEMTSE